MAEIILNQDYLDALNTHKRSNCPNLSGLNKRQLGQLARKLGLEVIATGVKERADGTGAGTQHNYPTRGRTTWTGTAKERDDRRNRDLNRKFGKMNMDKQRALGQDVLDGVRDRVKKAERERRNEERDKKLEEIQQQQQPKEQPKPKPKKKLKLKLVDIDSKVKEIGDKLRTGVLDGGANGVFYKNMIIKVFSKKKYDEMKGDITGIITTKAEVKDAVNAVIEKIGVKGLDKYIDDNTDKERLKEIEDEEQEGMIRRYINSKNRRRELEKAVKEVLGFNIGINNDKGAMRAVKSIIKKIGLTEAKKVLKDL